MINNDLEYRVTKDQIARLERALSAARTDEVDEGIHPSLLAAELTAIEAVKEELLLEVKLYEATRDLREAVGSLKAVENEARKGTTVKSVLILDILKKEPDKA